MSRYFPILLCLVVFLGCNSTPQSGGTETEEKVVTNNSVTPVNNDEEKKPVATKINRNLESPDIRVQISGAPMGQARLIGVFADQNYMLASADIDASGSVVFKQAEPFKPGLAFVVLPDNTNFQMLIDADQTFTMTTNKASMVNSMEVEGSVDNQLFYDNLKTQAAEQPQLNRLNGQLKTLTDGTPEYKQVLDQRDQILVKRQAELERVFKAHPNSFYTKFKSAGQNPIVRDVKKVDGTTDYSYQVYLYRREFWDNVDFNDERLLYTPVIHNKLKRYIEELTQQRADSLISSTKYLIDQLPAGSEMFKFMVNWIALKYEPGKVALMDAEAVRVFLTKNYFTKEKAFWADEITVYNLQKKATEMELSLLGLKGPDVEAKDPDGNLKSIYALKDPYIVVFMFNPDCDHCQEEAPELVKFYNQWDRKGVDIFTIAVDTNEEQWKTFLRNYGLKGTHVYDPSNRAIYGKYYVDNTPEVYVLDPNRTIIAKNLKVYQIAEVIEEDKKK